MCERPAKRVRFDAPAPSDGETSAAESAAESVGGASLDAESVIEVRFASCSGDVGRGGASGPHDDALTARPTFAHQVYPGGRVVGWARAKAALYVACGSLGSWVDFDGEREDGGAAAKAGAEAPPPAGEGVTDVAGGLRKLVAAGGVGSREEFLDVVGKEDEYLPPFEGEAMMEYERCGRKFSVFKTKLLADPRVVDYHKRMQLLMFLHIDGANFIDSTDLRWELFVILEHVNGAPRHLVAYATVYPFSALRPGRSIDDGFAERVRVSQVFVLPRFQRGGHGGMLLRAVYRDAAERKAIEVTVEDPSEGFRLLRDATDLPRAYADAILETDKPMQRDEAAAVVAKLREGLLITKAQARRCVEVHELRFVDRESEEECKKYRLWVKRRLYYEWQEVLDAFTGDERKAKLGEIYEDYEKEYLVVVGRLARTAKGK